MKRSLKRVLFVLVIAAQLYVPYRMAQTQENILQYGHRVELPVQVYPPSDAYGANYLALRFGLNAAPHPKGTQLPHRGGKRPGYVVLQPDATDTFHIADVTVEKPEAPIYFRAKVHGAQDNKYYLEYPFDRIYLPSALVEDAGEKLSHTFFRSYDDTYVVARLLNGAIALEALYIDGLPLEDYVERHSAPRPEPR